MNAAVDIDNTMAQQDLAKLFGETEENESLRLDIKRLIWGIWQRRLLVLLLPLLFALAGVGIALVAVEPAFKARSTLIKKEKQDEFRVGRFGLPFKTQEYSFKTLLDTLMLPSTLDQAMLRAGVHMPSSDFARLVDVHLGKESKAFTISVLWNDPGMSAELTNHLADIFIERNRAMRKQEIESQLINYRARLEAAEARSRQASEDLRNFEAANEISDLQTQLTVLLEKRQEVEVLVTSTQGDLQAKSEQMERLGSSITNEPDMIVQTSYYVNPMAKNLAQLEWELSQARGRYTIDNPKVKDLMQRIEKIKMIIREGKDQQTPSQTFAHNPVKQELAITRYEVEADILRLQTRRDRLASMVAELSARIARLTETRKQHEVLVGKRDSADTLMQDLRQRVDSMEVIYRGNLGDFETLERATPPDRPESSGRKLIVIAFFLLGGLVGFGYALGAELLQPRLRTLKDLGFLGEFEVTSDFVSSNSPRINPKDPASADAREFRRFANDLQIAMARTGSRTICFAGAESGAGASTAAVNTALSLYLRGETVIFVDADLRRDRDNVRMPANKMAPPLLNLLRGKTRITSIARGLTYIPAAEKGARTDFTALEIGGSRMGEVTRNLRHRDAYVIYNLPPLTEEEAAFEALKEIGTLVLTCRSDRTPRRSVARLLERLAHHKVRVIAGLMTDVPAELMTGGTIDPREDLQDHLRNLCTFSRRVGDLAEPVTRRLQRAA